METRCFSASPCPRVPASAHAAPLWIVDATLRDGEQAPKVAFTPIQRLELARMLAEAGVDEIEAGTPAMGTKDQETIRDMAAMGLACRITCWCRAHADDIRAAARCKTGAVHVSLPVSPIVLAAMGRDAGWVMGALSGWVPRLRNEFAFVSVGALDATRADPAFLLDYIRSAAHLGAHRVRLADTVGIALPMAVDQLVRRAKAAAPDLAIEFHGHNDLGMATANALSAALAGADAISATVNGLGERAGNAALEQVVAAINLATSRRCKVNPACLAKLCRQVAAFSGRPIPADRPISGEAVFTHESGIHCKALLADPLSYQPFLPETVGRKGWAIVAGRHSGRASLRHLQQIPGADSKLFL